MRFYAAKVRRQSSPASKRWRTRFAVASATVFHFAFCATDSAPFRRSVSETVSVSAVADRSLRLSSGKRSQPSSSSVTVSSTSASGTRKSSMVPTTDKPLTFHSKVKSSGYGQSAPSQLFKPRTNCSANSRIGSNAKCAKNKVPKSTLLTAKYPMDCACPAKHVTTLELSEANTAVPINAIRWCRRRSRQVSRCGDGGTGRYRSGSCTRRMPSKRVLGCSRVRSCTPLCSDTTRP